MIITKAIVVCDGWGPYYDRRSCKERADVEIVDGSIQFPDGWMQFSDNKIMCPNCLTDMHNS